MNDLAEASADKERSCPVLRLTGFAVSCTGRT